MIISITLKDPDGVYDSIRNAAQEQVDNIEGIEEDEADTLCDKRHNEIADSLEPWIKYGEYVRLEIDTEKKTATVITSK